MLKVSFQMPMLLPRITNVRISVLGIQRYMKCLNDKQKNKMLKTVKITIAISQYRIQISTRYVGIDRIRCLNGQYVA